MVLVGRKKVEKIRGNKFGMHSGTLVAKNVFSPNGTFQLGYGTGANGGAQLDGVNNNKACVFYAEIPVSITNNASNVRTMWNRLRISANADVSGGGCNCASQATTMVYGGSSTTALAGWATCGAWGSLGMDGTNYITLTGASSVAAGVMAEIAAGAGFTCGSGAFTAGLYVIGNTNSSATMTGSFAGICINNQDSTLAFKNSVEIVVAPSVAILAVPHDNTICDDAGTKGSTAGGFITVLVGTSTRYINLVTGA